MKTTKPRMVKIVTRHSAHFVAYVDRAKGGRHYAAQFDASSNSMETVLRWIRSRPHLCLVADK